METIKTIMQTTRPRITWKVLPMAQAATLKKYSIKCEKILDCELFYSGTKTSQRLTLYLLSSTDNIYIVLENDNTVLIKGLKKVVMLNSQETRIL